MWKNIICIATGAGIAPVLPCLLQQTAPTLYVVWITSAPATFGPVLPTLQKYPGQYKVYDTKNGRPDVVTVALKAVLGRGAQAVYVVANPAVTYQVVRGCASVGVKAFGAIWDS